MTYKPFIVGHRGLSGLYPENTLLAFQKALELPVNAIEFDLHPTADGHIVVTHDDNLERCSNGTGPVREKTLAELKQLDFGSRKSPEFAGTQIPTFNELLDLVEKLRPEIFLCVELKEDHEGCAIAALDELKRRNRLHNCSIISFKPAMLRLANAYEPNMEIHGFEAKNMTPEEAEDYYSILKRVGYPHKDMTPELVEKYHARGIRVDVWAPDTPEDFQRVVDMKVDFITTNRADLICKAAGRM